jgi:predicted ester cyclase
VLPAVSLRVAQRPLSKVFLLTPRDTDVPGDQEIQSRSSSDVTTVTSLEESTTMKATEITRRYHDAWCGRDPDALVALFTKDGTFCNPDTYPGINGKALANFVKGVWTAFPDIYFELLNAGEIEPGVVAHHWELRGTNTGPGADGSQPTGRAVSIKGASIIHVEGDKIRSDQCYFDREALHKQLEPT